MTKLTTIKQHFKNGGIKEILKFTAKKLLYFCYGKPKAILTDRSRRKKEAKRAAILNEKVLFSKNDFKRQKLLEKSLPQCDHGDYRERKFKHTTRRFLSRLLYAPSIKKNQDTKILVVLHFFYQYSVKELIQYLKNLDCYNYDLVVSYVEDNYHQEALDLIKQFKPDTKFVKYANKGYDIGPFLNVLNETDLDAYDIIIKLQSKSTDKDRYIYNQLFKGRDWFENLWDGVLGDFSVHKTIAKLQKSTEYGLVAAKNLIINDPAHKEELVKETLENYRKIKYLKKYQFVAGSCFAIKAECLKPIQALHLSVKDFENTAYGFFSLAHVMERAVCFSCLPKYQMYGNKVDFKRHAQWQKAEKELHKLSDMRILEKGQKVYKADFVWNVLECGYNRKNEFVKIKLGDIKRQHPADGSIRTLSQCEPYLWLKGNKGIYKEYSDFHIKNNLPHMTIERFKKLISSIEKNGYDDKYPIVIDNNNIIWDGQHRACILLNKYGPKHEVKVLKITPTYIDFEAIKPFSKRIPLLDQPKY